MRGSATGVIRVTKLGTRLSESSESVGLALIAVRAVMSLDRALGCGLSIERMGDLERERGGLGKKEKEETTRKRSSGNRRLPAFMARRRAVHVGEPREGEKGKRERERERERESGSAT